MASKAERCTLKYNYACNFIEYFWKQKDYLERVKFFYNEIEQTKDFYRVHIHRNCEILVNDITKVALLSKIVATTGKLKSNKLNSKTYCTTSSARVYVNEFYNQKRNYTDYLLVITARTQRHSQAIFLTKSSHKLESKVYDCNGNDFVLIHTVKDLIHKLNIKSNNNNSLMYSQAVHPYKNKPTGNKCGLFTLLEIALVCRFNKSPFTRRKIVFYPPTDTRKIKAVGYHGPQRSDAANKKPKFRNQNKPNNQYK